MTWLRNLIPLAVLSAVVYAPLLGYTYATFRGPVTASDRRLWRIVVDYGGAVSALALSGSVAYGVFEQLSGRPVALHRIIGRGIARLVPVVLVGTLVSILSSLAGVFLVVPGVLVFCMLYVAVPAAAVERLGIKASLDRSAALTQGHHGTILAALFALFSAIYLPFVFGVLALAPSSPPALAPSPWWHIATHIAIGSLFAVLNAVTYYSLRTAQQPAVIG